jgi:hypothetical protein
LAGSQTSITESPPPNTSHKKARTSAGFNY